MTERALQASIAQAEGQARLLMRLPPGGVAHTTACPHSPMVLVVVGSVEEPLIPVFVAFRVLLAFECEGGLASQVESLVGVRLPNLSPHRCLMVPALALAVQFPQSSRCSMSVSLPLEWTLPAAISDCACVTDCLSFPCAQKKKLRRAGPDMTVADRRGHSSRGFSSLVGPMERGDALSVGRAFGFLRRVPSFIHQPR